MKNATCLFLLIACFSCSSKKEEKAETLASPERKSETVALSEEKAGQQFLDLFTPLKQDTVLIEPESGDQKPVFKGKPVSLNLYKFFADAYPKEERESYLAAESTTQHDGEADFKAYWKFPVSEKLTGLVLKTPSYYESSSFKLFIWDNSRKRALEQVEIAETWGDAGDAYEAASQLILKPQPEIIKHAQITWADEEDMEKQTTYDSLYFYQFRNGKINLLKKEKADPGKLKSFGF